MKTTNLILILIVIYVFSHTQYAICQSGYISINSSSKSINENFILFCDSAGNVKKKININSSNPFSKLLKTKETVSRGSSVHYLIDYKNFNDIIPSSALTLYNPKVNIENYPEKYLLAETSWETSIVNITGYGCYKHLALAYTLRIKAINGDLVFGVKSYIFVYNSEGHVIFSDSLNKQVSSVAISDDGKRLGYGCLTGWSDDMLYSPSIRIVEIPSNNSIFESEEGCECYFVWQIKGAIAWSGLSKYGNVDFYLLDSNEIIIVKNDLPNGIFEINSRECIFINKDKSLFSRPILSKYNHFKN